MSQFATFEEYKTALVELVLRDAEEQWKAIELQRRLENLHKELGFRSAADLIDALKKVTAAAAKAPAKAPKAKGKKGKKGKKAAAPADAPADGAAPAPAAKPAKKSKKGGRRSRVTDEVKAKFKEALDGGVSVLAAGKSVGISQPTAYKLAKEFKKAA
ncbi:MAG: hypothetical protein LBR07_01415 [Puniceicoccales bacterium]|jgi:hypothetical protein|nr:hypothetical protein [Puniceicoccales bacterium]